MYTVFTRNWYKPDGTPNYNARKTIIARNVQTEESARDICRVWNANHEPGTRSIKAEYTSGKVRG